MSINKETIINADIISENNNLTEKEIEIESTENFIKEKTNNLINLSSNLIKEFNSPEEKEYLYKLKGEFGGDLKKLDKLQADIVGTKISNVKNMLEESGYDISKIEFILGADTVEKMNLVKDKVSAIKSGTLTLDEERIKDNNTSDSKSLANIDKKFGRHIIKRIFNVSKGIFGGLKEEIKDLSDTILKTKDNLIILEGIRTDIEKIIQDVLDSKEKINKNYQEYYKNYIAISFISEELKELKTLKEKELETKELNTIKKRELERDIKKIVNRLERLETSKILIGLYVNQEQNIAYELELIADNIELEYKEASDVVSMTLISLLAQQPIKDGIDVGNLLKDLKNSSIKSYVSSTNSLRDNMIQLHTSSKTTKKILIESISSTRDNIVKNKQEIENLSGENKKLNSDMLIEMKRLEDVLNKEDN